MILINDAFSYRSISIYRKSWFIGPLGIIQQLLGVHGLELV